MKKIEEFADNIEDELDDADKYARLALENKEDDRESGDLYYRLSNEELGHADALHKRVVSLIDSYKKAEGEPPAEMLWRYEYLHKKYIKYCMSIKNMLSMYK